MHEEILAGAESDEAAIDAVDRSPSAPKNADAFPRTAIVRVAFYCFSRLPITLATKPTCPFPPPVEMAKTIPGFTLLGSFSASSCSKICVPLARRARFQRSSTLPVLQSAVSIGFFLFQRARRAGETEEDKRDAPRFAGIDPDRALIFANSFSLVAAGRIFAHADLTRCDLENFRDQLVRWFCF